MRHRHTMSLLAAAGLAIPSVASAQSTFMLNLGNWHEAGNWSPNGVPNASTEVLIGAATPREAVISSADAAARHINLGSINGQTGTLNISNGRKLTVNLNNQSGSINVGREGVGNLFVSGGARVDSVFLSFGGADVFQPVNSFGTGIFSGAGTRVDTRVLTVGDRGRGELLIQNGAVVEAAVITNISVANHAAVSNNLTINGQGSLLTTPTLQVGLTGLGTLTIENGGQANATQTILGSLNDIIIGPKGVGTLNLNGTEGARGTLVTGYIRRGSDDNQPAGSAAVRFNGGLLNVTQSGDIFRNFENGTVEIAAGGAFIQSSNATANIGLQGVGSLTKVGTGTLLLSAANTYLGDTHVNSGRLIVDGSIQGSATTYVRNGARLGGNGVISGNVVVELDSSVFAGGGVNNSYLPGELFIGGNMEWNSSVYYAASYIWTISDADGQSGNPSGWAHISMNGALNIVADADNPAIIDVRAVSDTGPYDALSNWDPTINQQWTILTALGGINGFDEATTRVSSVYFSLFNDIGDGYFWLSVEELPMGPAGGGGAMLILHYTVPTPGALALLAMGALHTTRRTRRRTLPAN